jgi:hypothetical protein
VTAEKRASPESAAKAGCQQLQTGISRIVAAEKRGPSDKYSDESYGLYSVILPGCQAGSKHILPSWAYFFFVSYVYSS